MRRACKPSTYGSRGVVRDGAPSRTRTYNLRIRSPLLYPLSHGRILTIIKQFRKNQACSLIFSYKPCLYACRKSREAELSDKPGSVVGQLFISSRCRHLPLARNPNARKSGRIAFLFALAPNGVYQAILLPKYWCALTTPFQLFPRLAREFSFLWHFPSGCPAQPLAGIVLFGARTFLTISCAIALDCSAVIF